MKIRNLIFHSKVMSRHYRDGLYYHCCHREMKKNPPRFTACKPMMYRPTCLACFVRAAKALYMHHVED
ncbi:MAG: hypothetical protein HQL08_08730 [Nitrospirae bacterium]|nr:hypothetical protein [Nitrospirota bacterium]